MKNHSSLKATEINKSKLTCYPKELLSKPWNQLILTAREIGKVKTADKVQKVDIDDLYDPEIEITKWMENAKPLSILELHQMLKLNQPLVSSGLSWDYYFLIHLLRRQNHPWQLQAFCHNKASQWHGRHYAAYKTWINIVIASCQRMSIYRNMINFHE